MKGKLEILGERLKVLRETRNLTQKAVAKHFSVNENTVGHWETGKRNPDPQTIHNLAKYYDASSDYLLGLTDDPRSIEQRFEASLIGHPDLAAIWERFKGSNEMLSITKNMVTSLSDDDMRTIVRLMGPHTQESKETKQKD